MTQPPYFFVGIGGSGMLPLAAILRGRGATVSGSDRAYDQGRTPGKFAYLEAQGIHLFPQDGSGVTDAAQTVVASAAIESSVPDIAAATRIGAPRLTRAQLLAQLFNAAPVRIAVGGTSGKSTTTGMIGWILSVCSRDPTIMNGAVMKNFAGADAAFSSAVVGHGDAFVSEVDESDGSIALYRPTIALVTNVTLDHKPLDELRPLFAAFASRADIAILNADDPESAALAGPSTLTYGFTEGADVRGTDIVEAPTSISFTVAFRSAPIRAPAQAGAQARTRSWTPAGAGEQDSTAPEKTAQVTLPVPGRHNGSNALAALAAAIAVGVPLADAAAALATFTGLKRRFEILGSANGVTVIDDFAHNPNKIAATLATLHAFPGRLLLFFQPQGYGPLAVLKDALIDAFADAMRAGDILILCDPAYFGGTVDRRVGSADIADGLAARDAQALHIPARAACGAKLAELARPGDRIVIMGARDDSLSEFAADVLGSLT